MKRAFFNGLTGLERILSKVKNHYKSMKNKYAPESLVAARPVAQKRLRRVRAAKIEKLKVFGMCFDI